MQRVEVPKTEKEEKARKTYRAGNHDSPPRPTSAVAHSMNGELEIEYSDRQHRPGQGDPIMGHEGQEARIDRDNLPARYPHKRLIVGKHHARYRNKPDQYTPNEQSNSYKGHPYPARLEYTDKGGSAR